MADTIGFISVKQHAEHGYFGGYLILNYLARPLEFHCTMPVKPSRAQALLYGPTIHDFVCGEQIAKALIAKAKLNPTIVLTNCAPVLSVSLVSNVGVAMMQTSHSELPTSLDLKPLKVADCEFSIPVESKLQREQLEATLESLSPNFELSEPFQRINEAILEAHPVAKAA